VTDEFFLHFLVHCHCHYQLKQDYCILHLGTRSPLAADTEYPTQTNFGGEYEVACHQYLSMGKTLNMIRERDGVTTGDVGQRAQLPHNRWAFVSYHQSV